MKKLLAAIFSLGLIVSANAADFSTTPNTSIFNATTTPATATDQAILEDIRGQVSSGWFTKGYDRVSFQVNNGAVLLQGSVPTADDKVKLERAIRGIDGVRSLTSQISVQNGAAPATTTNKTFNLNTNGSSINSNRLMNTTNTLTATQFPQDISATPADKLLNAKIRDNVSVGYLWNSYEDVRLNTSNGTVTLEGTVDSIDDQETLLDAIRNIDGVRNVTSKLNFTDSE